MTNEQIIENTVDLYFLNKDWKGFLDEAKQQNRSLEHNLEKMYMNWSEKNGLDCRK